MINSNGFFKVTYFLGCAFLQESGKRCNFAASNQQ